MDEQLEKEEVLYIFFSNNYTQIAITIHQLILFYYIFLICKEKYNQA